MSSIYFHVIKFHMLPA